MDEPGVLGFVKARLEENPGVDWQVRRYTRFTEAAREIVGKYEEYLAEYRQKQAADSDCEETIGCMTGLELALVALARVDRDHPDYDKTQEP